MTTPAPLPSPVRQVLEDALAANPDDLGAHMAYADWLTEQGDPRGEFIQVQLALEDPGRSADERQRLRQREGALLSEHHEAWLGALAPYASPAQDWARVEWRFARGWLDRLVIPLLQRDLARALAGVPQTRLLRGFIIDTVVNPEFDDAEAEARARGEDAVSLLAASPYLGNVRAFHLGGKEGFVEDASGPHLYNSVWNLHVAGDETWALIARMERLEELYLSVNPHSIGTLFGSDKLTNLRVLQVYLADDYPLDVLAGNPALRKLTHLSLHPRSLGRGESRALLRLPEVWAVLRSPNLPSLTHLRLHQSNLGDQGCREIAASGILRRLKFLDLARGCITDEGARVLARCPDLRRLDVLDVSCNALTPVGIEALRAAVPTLRAEDQHGPNDLEYLFEGEME